MATQESVYADAKRAELERWGEWREQFTELVTRCEIVADEIDGMEAGGLLQKPEPYSVNEAAGIFDLALPLIEELAQHGYTPENAAAMLREAADRIEGSS